jgi:hypothetical protein
LSWVLSAQTKVVSAELIAVRDEKNARAILAVRHRTCHISFTMANTEWWQRGPVDSVPSTLQPVAHILLQVGESVDELTADLTDAEWNARPAGVASAAFHVRHMAGVIDRLFTYARGEALSEDQFASMRAEGDRLAEADVPATIAALHARIAAALVQLRATNPETLGEFRAVGRAKLPSTVIGCLVHGAEHAMRHVGQLSVTVRVARGAA